MPDQQPQLPPLAYITFNADCLTLPCRPCPRGTPIVRALASAVPRARAAVGLLDRFAIEQK